MKNLRRLFSREAAADTAVVIDRSSTAKSRTSRRGRAGGRRSGRDQRGTRRQLISESLEQRRLMASDLNYAVIDGPDFQVAYAHNYHMAADVDSNYKITALDALKVINALNKAGGTTPITDFGQFNYMVDVDANNELTALDALKVINALNRGAGEDTVPDLVAFGITPRTLDDVQLLTIPDPEPDPIFGGFNANSNTFQTPRPPGPREANVRVGDIFKLEVQTQDLRGRSSQGVFQVANDIIISSKGVLEPVAAEVQTFTFPATIRDPGNPSGDIVFTFDGDPTEVRLPRDDVFVTDFVQRTAAQVASAITQLRPEITREDLSFSGEQDNETETFTLTIRYTGDDLVNTDVPFLNIVPTDESLRGVRRQFNVRNEAGQFSDTALLAALDLRSRNVDPATRNDILFGSDRTFGSFDDISTDDPNVNINDVDLFNEIGANGPLATFTQFLIPPGESLTTFDNRVGYDAYAIPVRAVRAQSGVQIFLDPADSGETVLLYDQADGKDQAAPEQIQLGERASFVLNVLPAAGPITANPGTLNVSENDADGESINVADLVTVAAGGDPDSITIDSTGVTGTVAFDAATSILTFTPAPNTVGSQTISYTATAGEDSATGTITVTINNVDDAPVAVNDVAEIDVNVANSVTIDVLANDSPGVNDAQTLSIVDVNNVTGGATVDFSSGTNVVYTPAAGSTGTETFTYVISDGVATASATVTVTVADNSTGPVVQTPFDVAVDEDSGETQLLDLETLVTPDDVAGRIFAITQPTVGSARLEGSVLFYTPPANVFGAAAASVPFSVTDPAGVASAGTRNGVVSINITGVNDDPIAVDDTATVAEGGTVRIPVLANDNAGPGESDVLTIQSVTQPAAGLGNVTIDGTDLVFTSANTAAAGNATFTYTIDDGSGGIATANVTVTVTDVLDAPIAADSTLSGTEDGGNLTLDLATLVTLEGDDAVTFSLISGATGTVGSASISGSTLTFAPAANQSGTQTIVYRATSTRTGEPASDDGTITVTLTATNDAPTGNGFTVVLDANGAATVDVAQRGNVVDIDGDALTYSISTPPGNGTATITPAGILSYTQTASTGADDTLTVTATDGTESVNLVVTLSETPLPPGVGTIPVQTVAEEGTATLDLNPLIANNSGNPLVFSAPTTSGGGTASVNAGILTFTPVANFNGTDTVSLTVSNGVGDAQPVTVAFNVTAVNDAPVASSRSQTVTINTTTTIDLATLVSDADDAATSLTFALVNPPAGATLNGSTVSFVAGPAARDVALQFTATGPLGRGQQHRGGQPLGRRRRNGLRPSLPRPGHQHRPGRPRRSGSVPRRRLCRRSRHATGGRARSNSLHRWQRDRGLAVDANQQPGAVHVQQRALWRRPDHVQPPDRWPSPCRRRWQSCRF